MYESHFGFTGSPFQLNPDPLFYFGSRGHSNALSYLKFGVHQGEGFIVVTGEIGAGKTTLVRTLLGELDASEIVAAQILNTQLESGELLQSILTAYGVAAVQGATKAQLLATLEAFLTGVAAEGRRVLLVVDEAQNLGPGAIEEIRMLSNFQLGNHALLQTFLVGQPELRKQLESPSMEQLRQRVIASCHLGPLSVEETQAYVEHRLRHVGWDSRPSFGEGAFAAIYAWTGGIPRRINLLCNRLLLAAFLAELEDVSAQLVETTGAELLRETGGARGAPAATARAAESKNSGREAERARAEPSGHEPLGAGEVVRVPRAHANLAGLPRPIVCIADTPLGYLKASALAATLRSDAAMPPVVLVNPGPAGATEVDDAESGLGSGFAEEIHLGVDTPSTTEAIAGVVMRLGEVLDELAPVAVVSAGISDAVLSGIYLSSKRGLPLGRLGAGQRRDMQTLTCDLNAVMADRMSEVLYTPTLKTHYTLYREGIPAGRMVCIGNLLRDTLRSALASQPPVSDLLKSLGLSRDLLRRAMRGFVLISAQVGEGDLNPEDLSKVARVARDLGKETLVVWVVTTSTRDAIAAGKAEVLLQRSGVVLAPHSGYRVQLGLMRGAMCVIAGPGWGLVEEADTVDVPSIVLHPGGEVPVGAPGGVIAKIPCDSVACMRALHEILERGRADDEVVDDSEGAAAARLLEHMRRWLPPTQRTQANQVRPPTDVSNR